MSLSTLILACLALGIGFGAVLHDYFPELIAPITHYALDPLGSAFLRLIQFVVVPIVFSAMILGLTRIQNAAQLGRYVIKLLTSYLVTSGIAVAVGMAIVTLLQPGAGITGFTASSTVSTEHQSLIDWLVSLIPVNPLEALSSGNLLQVIFSAALIGVAIQRVGGAAASFISFIESCYAIFEAVLALVLRVAPIGVFALIAAVIANEGLGIVVRLFVYVAGLLLSTALMMSLYTVILLLLKANPVRFFQSMFPALSLAFGTASSNAALPIALQNVQENYGLSAEIASFALPLGTALKRDGSAIMQGYNALFIAQVYQVDITPSLLVAIALSSLLVSFSTPGVPGSAIITMATVLSAAGLPVEGIAIIAGVDRLTDGVKTMLNVTGNTANAIVLSRWEKQLPSLPPLQPTPELTESNL
ncbi:MAG: dicarboxylate/amino acid:cation symporter [Aphanocapsa sp. GSE-SYN-MK-11-07L]|jgi:Na+/H+-dicarboxylate symporter|nr:dicarboxylate/amino acid:cation symporter [Aphanocapsa sp. GSE-SYN-MK-11-07L]